MTDMTMLLLGGLWKGFWDFGLEKSLRVQNLTSVSVGAWEIRTLRTGGGDGGLACEVLEGV